MFTGLLLVVPMSLIVVGEELPSIACNDIVGVSSLNFSFGSNKLLPLHLRP